MSGLIWIIYLAFVVLSIAGLWCVFVKAGQEGWKAIIPIWNLLIVLKIVGREPWWIILLLIPIVDVIFGIVVCIDLAKSFARGTGFAIGLIFFPFIFLVILGFGSDTYRGPAAAPAATA